MDDITKLTEQFNVHFGIKAFSEFLNEIKNESDRAAVILGAAKIDDVLAQLIKKFLLPNVSSKDELMEDDGPISSFSARINIAYRLGLIDNELTRNLHLIRKTRNEFAHAAMGCKLDASPHRERVNEVICQYKNYKSFMQYRKYAFPDQFSTSVDFKTILALIIINLEGRMYVIEQVKPLSIEPMRDILSKLDFDNPSAIIEGILKKPDGSTTVSLQSSDPPP